MKTFQFEDHIGLWKNELAEFMPKVFFDVHELDVRRANSYILQKAKEDSRLLPLLLYSPRDPEALKAGYAEAEKMGTRVYGVKPYLDFADKPGNFSAIDVDLWDFVTPDMLAFCEEHEMILLLHTCDIGVGSPALCGKIQHILDAYPWSDPEMLSEFKEERKKLTYNNYHALKALKDAIEKNFPEGEKRQEVIENLF